MSLMGRQQKVTDDGRATASPPELEENDDAGEGEKVETETETEIETETADLPLTMSASTVLLGLPRDATAALAAAGSFARDKVVVRFKAVGAPPLNGGSGSGGGGSGSSNNNNNDADADVRRKISATHKFEVVVAFVRRALRVRPTESVFLYVNSTFAPALDEVVGNLHQCFKDANDQLNVSYSLTPAFG